MSAHAVKIHNYLDGSSKVDTLHASALPSSQCTQHVCRASMVTQRHIRSPAKSCSGQDMIAEAKDFIDQYFASLKTVNSQDHCRRWEDVRASIVNRGTYHLTYDELVFGARQAWRNSARCVGRIHWSTLRVFDARHVTTSRGMYTAVCEHILYATNQGNIRSAITVFPQRQDGRGDFRIWNQQLIVYAGYRLNDGKIVGDPGQVTFTEQCIKLGWTPRYGRFDVLPLVLSASGRDPEMFEIPAELVLEVNIKHPGYPWFEELGLKWMALPAVSSMLLDCGGLQFPAAPFNGWYIGTEIGARNLCDVSRYNITELVAARMGLDTRSPSSLWKDRVLLEVNVAVLYSYRTSGVTIIDHHTACESFMKHMDVEQTLRGGCPGDWVWLVPPMSGSLTKVFHQEMLNYHLKPSYEYQHPPWKTRVWTKDGVCLESERKRTICFRSLAIAAKFSIMMMSSALSRRVKCTVLYATETGRSEELANTLCDILRRVFDVKVMCLDHYDVIDLQKEALVLFVVSTFGNGEPPENGSRFGEKLGKMKLHLEESMCSMTNEGEDYVALGTRRLTGLAIPTLKPLRNLKFSVFGLGSKAYRNYAAFGKYVDQTMATLGAERIHAMGDGDELCGQRESFITWADGVYTAARCAFGLNDDDSVSKITRELRPSRWTPVNLRIVDAVAGDEKTDLCRALSAVHGKKVFPCIFKERLQLQSKESDRQTILVKLATDSTEQVTYVPGDHIAAFPANQTNLVDSVLSHLSDCPSPDKMISIEQRLHETSMQWKTLPRFEKMPVFSMRSMLTYFLDLASPPSRDILQLLSKLASSGIDKESLDTLVTDDNAYQRWKTDSFPNILEVIQRFPSLKVTPSFLLSQLPLLQPRYFSVSSSPLAFPEEIHATIAVVKSRSPNGSGVLRQGVCSSWLNECPVGTVVPCFVTAASTFHLPEDHSLPIVMVAAGTGIAPFRSFWQQRKIDMEMNKNLPPQDTRKLFGKMILYFGCRYTNRDHIYKTELEDMKSACDLFDYHVAFSRDRNEPKTYVQDIMLSNATNVYGFIVNRGGHFYVCGDVTMVNDVIDTFQVLLQQQGDMTTEQAKQTVKDLRCSGRLHEDMFGEGV